MALFRRKRKPEPPKITFGDGEPAQPAPAGFGFGFKCAWLALRSTDTAGVAEALGLRDVTPSPWADGVATVYAAEVRVRPAPVFVCSPVDGWTLVPCAMTLDSDGVFDLAALSSRFGEAQRFATHRVVEAHEWERWVDGYPVRRYGWVGESAELLFSEGEPSELEEDLLPDAEADLEAWETADEERVMEIAAAWSIDPTRLDERDDVADLDPTGLLGRR